jgi:hypothetical protein
LDFAYDWEDWAELELETQTTKEFHFMAIRMLKGFIKAWRRWLIETKEESING